MVRSTLIAFLVLATNAAASAEDLAPPKSETIDLRNMSIEFDRFENRTVAKTQWTPAEKCDISLTLLSEAIGKDWSGAYSIALGFSSSSDEWQYLTSHQLSVLVDGKKVEMGPLDHDGKVGDGYVMEFMWTTDRVSLASLVTLSEADLAEFRIFTTECVFPESILEAAADLSEMIEKDQAKRKVKQPQPKKSLPTKK